MHHYFLGLTATGNFTALAAMRHLGFTTRLRPTEIAHCTAVDAVADLPVGYWFLGERLPLDDATLILTVRGDQDGWLWDCERQWIAESSGTLSALEIEARMEIFGQVEFAEKVWRAAYGRHLERCVALAARTGKRLHTWDVAAHPTWDFLCALTGRAAPDRPFPALRTRPASWPAGPPLPLGAADPEGRLRRAPIQIRPSPLGGRGVFAAKPIRDGALIEECPVLLIEAYIEELGDYVIGWGDRDDRRVALPLGYGACFNHSNEPNALWQTDEDHTMMIIWAARDLAADEEILISYGEEWFPSRGLRAAQDIPTS